MQLERIALRLRRRTPWEALDLGHAMLRAWAGPAYRLWLVSYWLTGLLLMGLLWQYQQVAFFLLWWLKPWFDRILLFAYSRSLFQTPTTLRDLRLALPGLVLRSGLLSGLTWRRFSLARSFLLPVWQLEGQRGRAATARCRVLARRQRDVAVWLTVVCANLGGVLWLGLIFLLAALMPGEWGEQLSVFEWLFSPEDLQTETVMGIVSTLLLMTAESIIEPFYVASGFALYINRRSELEGWDIDLTFRRLAARKTPESAASSGATPAAPPAAPPSAASAAHGRAAFAAGALLLLGLYFAAPLPAQAAEEAAPPGKAKQTIQEVLADPVFGHKSEEMEWRWRKNPAEEEKKKDLPNVPENKFVRYLEFVNQALEALVWIGAVALGAWLIYLIVLYRDRWLGRRERRAPPPDFLFGLDVRPESLPDDIVTAARAALAAGKVELALSLLYRGSLVALIHRFGLDLQPGDTEADCRRRAGGHLSAAADAYFGQLLDAWRSTAYARQTPPSGRLDALCEEWRGHFGAQQEGAAP